MKGFLPFVLIGLAALALAGDPKVRSTGPRLFKIKRSTNANEVIYEARLTDRGFDDHDPINIYWVMKAKNGALEPLTGIERSSAYGVSVRSASASEVVFTLKPLADRPVIARLAHAKGRRARAYTQIAGREAYLDSVFIEVQGSGILARPRAAVLQGRAVDDGTAVTERIERE